MRLSLAATISTPQCAPVIAATWLRGGSANTARGAGELGCRGHQRRRSLARPSEDAAAGLLLSGKRRNKYQYHPLHHGTHATPDIRSHA
jgi:hypothetical protein